MANIFVSELRRVPVLLNVIVILTRALNVHIPRVPVALLGDTLWAPMRPDAEFRISKPVRAVIGLERLPKRQEQSLRYLALEKLRVLQCMRYAGQCEDGESASEKRSAIHGCITTFQRFIETRLRIHCILLAPRDPSTRVVSFLFLCPLSVPPHPQSPILIRSRHSPIGVDRLSGFISN